MAQGNPYVRLKTDLKVDGKTYSYFDLTKLNDPRYYKLPFSIRVLVEAAVRNCDEFQVKSSDVENILNWAKSQDKYVEIPFKPARVLLQDFTAVPVMVDFVAMRDAVKRLGGDPEKIYPVCPVDLVVDHALQGDAVRGIRVLTPNPGGGGDTKLSHKSPTSTQCHRGVPSSARGSNSSSVCSSCAISGPPIRDIVCPFHQIRTLGADALEDEEEAEFERNIERFTFLKWGAKTLKNMVIIPPGIGIVHSVNLEYLTRVVFTDNDQLFPDSVIGTDSHTTMVNGLGVVGWGVGGIEAEAVMLGQTISVPLPQVVGYKLAGTLCKMVTSTDVVLAITKDLRTIGLSGKIVEFFGSGVTQLSISDRETISNMCPEYGAVMGFFPVDKFSIDYLQQQGRDPGKVAATEAYLKTVRMLRDFGNSVEDPTFSQVVELDLSTVKACCSGPKRQQDRVDLPDMKEDFLACLNNKIGFKGYHIPPEMQQSRIPFMFQNHKHHLHHGDVIMAAISSCTNTTNPSVMLAAGLLAKKAIDQGLHIRPFIQTSLSPGTGIVTYYLKASGVLEYLEKLGFCVIGYGCGTCIGNSGPLDDSIKEAIDQGDLVTVGIHSGNRNFETRVHPLARANYLVSPLLVIAYAIAGTVCINFDKESIGKNKCGKSLYLKDIWPTREEVQAIEQSCVVPAMFKEVCCRMQNGNERWNKLKTPVQTMYPWDANSTYIKSPHFFEHLHKELVPNRSIKEAYPLLSLGDSVTTDHISPAGSIARGSPAAKYLTELGLNPRSFNSYGSRRGNDAIMARGAFANIRLENKLAGRIGPKTLLQPANELLDIFEAAERYKKKGIPVIILAGKDYGCGSSRDWAAKGPWMLGVRAVLAESYDRIHRSNLVGMGIIPLQFMEGTTLETLKLSGKEKFSFDLPNNLTTSMEIKIKTDAAINFPAKVRFESDVELAYFQHGGLLQYVIRNML